MKCWPPGSPPAGWRAALHELIRRYQLAETWGPPNIVSIDKEFNYSLLGWASVLMGTVMIDAPAIWLGSIGLLSLISPPPPEMHVWTKGNYQVEALTYDTPASGKKRKVSYWDWQVKKGENYVPLFEKDKRRFHGLLQFRFAKGFADIGDTDVNNPAGGSGVQLDLGLEYENLLKRTDFLFLYGYRTNILVDHNDKNKDIKVTSYPIQLLAMYKLDKRWRAGGGLHYLSNTTLDYNFQTDQSLKDALGVVFYLDFKTYHQHRFGIAIEAVKQDLPNGGSFNSSNFSAYSRLVFW